MGTKLALGIAAFTTMAVAPSIGGGSYAAGHSDARICFECKADCPQGGLWHRDPFPPEPLGTWEPFISSHVDCVSQTCNLQHDNTCIRFAAEFGNPRDLVARIMSAGLAGAVELAATSAQVDVDVSGEYIQVGGCDGRVYANIPVLLLQ